MIKKGLFFLIVILLSLPGCGGHRKKKSEKSKKMARTTGFSRVGIPLAEGETLSEDDANVRSFYDDDMQDFMTFAQDGDDFKLEGGNREYAWLNQPNVSDKELQIGYFDFDRHNVRPDEQPKAKRNAEKIKKHLDEHKDLTLVVEGHACNFGSTSYNLALTEKRAKSYASFLEANGVPADRIKTVGRGKELLVVKEGSKEAQWPNRRVELHEIYDNASAPTA